MTRPEAHDKNDPRRLDTASASGSPSAEVPGLPDIPRRHTKEVVLQEGQWVLIDNQVALKFSSISGGASSTRRKSLGVIKERDVPFKIAKPGEDLSVPIVNPSSRLVRSKDIDRISHKVHPGFVGYIGRSYRVDVLDVGNNLRLTVSAESRLHTTVFPSRYRLSYEDLARRINTFRTRGRR